MAARELSALRTVTPAEVELAKQTLKGKLTRNNTATWRRLEERTKSLYYLGATNEHINSQIDALTPAQVQAAVDAALKTPLTFVTRGGEVNTLPSYDSISKRFN